MVAGKGETPETMRRWRKQVVDHLRRLRASVDIVPEQHHPFLTVDVRRVGLDQLLKLKKEQFNLRFQRATQQLEKPAEVRKVRREIARVKTILGQKAAAAK